MVFSFLDHLVNKMNAGSIIFFYFGLYFISAMQISFSIYLLIFFIYLSINFQFFQYFRKYLSYSQATIFFISIIEQTFYQYFFFILMGTKTFFIFSILNIIIFKYCTSIQKMQNKISILLILLLLYPLNTKQQQTNSTQTQTQTNTSTNNNNKKQIYGVRWSLGDHFSYSSLFKTHPLYTQPQTYAKNSNYYILAFNSDIQFQQDVILYIGDTINTCSSRKVSVPITPDHVTIQLKQNSTLNSTDTFIYRCYVNFDIRIAKRKQENLIEEEQFFDEYQYLIYLQTTQFLYRSDSSNNSPNSTILNRKVNLIKQILYNSTFRSPLPRFSSLPKLNMSSQSGIGQLQQSILVLGDWGIISQDIQKSKGYIPVFGSIYNRLQWDDNLVLVLFLGDLAYDLVGEKYVQMLKYIEPISSTICFMTTPGNHDYSYHLDSFELFAETFITPQWSKYFNFYYNFILGDFMFINYVPSNTVAQNKQFDVKSIQYIQGDLYNNYARKLGQNSNQSSDRIIGTIDPIYKQYHVIVFSHYPVLCSKPNDGLKSCEQNIKKLTQYLQVFTDLGMDLYLSGHLHYYERTHGMCWDKIRKQMKIQKYTDIQKYEQRNVTLDQQIYSQNCPVYVIDGSAGNSYFQQEEASVKPSNFTSKITYNTGYGILSLQTERVESDVKKNSYYIENYIQYSHYKMIQTNKSILNDKFTKQLPVLQHNQPKDFDDDHTQQIKDKSDKNLKDDIDTDTGTKFFKILFISFIFTLAIIICCFYGKKAINRLTSSQNKNRGTSQHDMVEQQIPKTGTDLQKNENIL